jgi:PAS domain S-box-containing protein/putative nucleotidyltransferase with HDIG domain
MAGVTDQDGKESSSSQLRAEAEKKVARSAAKSAPLKKQVLDKLVHELRVHQVELEMQNEELRGAQEQIAKSQNDYADLYDYSPVGYLTFNGDVLITGVNLTGAALLGVERQKLLKRRFRQFVAPADAGLWDRHFVSVLQQGEKQSCDLQLRRNDGSTIHARLDSIRVEMDDGTCVVRTAMSDVTIQKQAAEALKESEAQYRLLSDHMTDFIWLMDMNLKPTYQSPSAEKLTGFTHEEIMELPLERRVTPQSLKLTAEVFLENLPRIMSDTDYNPILALELEIYRKDGTTLWSENMFSIIRDETGKPVSILGEARDITERKQSEEKLLKSYESLKKTLNDAINTMVKIVELRDPYTAGHQNKVADLATAIAREMKLEDTRIDQIRTAAVIHDIGKIYVPSDILSRPGKLTDIEFNLIKTHAQSGYDIVDGMDFPGVVAAAVLQHHERLDGSGYPNQLKGEDTLLEAKILAVADVVEAMASHRPYRSALGIDKALDEISKNKGKLYDPDVVDTCVELFNSGRFEFKSV